MSRVGLHAPRGAQRRRMVGFMREAAELLAALQVELEAHAPGREMQG